MAEALTDQGDRRIYRLRRPGRGRRALRLAGNRNSAPLADLQPVQPRPSPVLSHFSFRLPPRWSGLDLNPRDPSISLPVIMVSIVQPMKTRFVFELTSNLSNGHAFR